jgi:very-short-patch-repair endonuclease
MRRHTSSPRNGRSHILELRAREMRRGPTLTEARLFQVLRGGRLGVSFRRQVPVLGRFIVDLLAPEIRLIVEIDGAYHRDRSHADARRDRALARAGYRVLRLDAELVLHDLEAAVARVRQAIAEPR